MLTIYVAIILSYAQLFKGIGNYATRENNNGTDTHTLKKLGESNT